MAEGVEFDGERQKRALRGLQRDAGLTATNAASALGMSYPNYRRYLDGAIPLGSDQFRPFARVYGVTVGDLLRSLGFLDDDAAPAPAPLDDEQAPEGWSFRAYLAPHVPPDALDAFDFEYGRLPYWTAKAHADEIIAGYAEWVRARTLRPRCADGASA